MVKTVNNKHKTQEKENERLCNLSNRWQTISRGNR